MTRRPEPDPLPDGVSHISKPLDIVMGRLALRLNEVAAARPEADPDRLWGIADVGRYLHVSRRGVERLRAAGRLPRPAIVIGRMPRWKAETIRRWIDGGGA